MSYYPPPIPGSPPPLPVQTFSYATPVRSGRPGILTAVGVVSICLACFSLLSSAGGIFTAVVFSTMVRGPGFGTPATITLNTTTAGSANGSATVVFDNVDGLDANASQLIVDAMTTKRALGDEREAQLKALMMKAGQKIFPGGASARTQVIIRNNVSESGSIPGVGSGGSTYFIVGTGRIEVYDDHAVFRPDGSTETVSVSKTADETSPSDQTQAAAGTAPAGATSSSGAGMPGPAMTPTAARMAMGSAFSKSTMLVSAGENLVSLGVAVILLTAGIMTLRDSRKAGKWHWVYLFVKIPLVILASVTGMMMMRGTMSSMGMGMPAGMPGGPNWFSMFMLVGAVFGLAIGLAYPVALIFILRSRDVRDYYGAVTE